jgi:hypothetical protein
VKIAIEYNITERKRNKKKREEKKRNSVPDSFSSLSCTNSRQEDRETEDNRPILTISEIKVIMAGTFL